MDSGRSLPVKISSKYDHYAESEVRNWIKELTGEEIDAGPENMFHRLKDGTLLVRLVQKVYESTPDLPEAPKEFYPYVAANESKLPFKQMQNIDIFLRACEIYGVPEVGIFSTNNLYENKNMMSVIDCIQMLGTEAQRNNFQGPICGPKPTTANRRNFGYEILKAGHGIIGSQSGSNKYASQKGMSIGAVRHASDIKADEMSQESQGIINLQSGTNKFASQKGMRIGAVRHVSDIKADAIAPESHSIINLQSGTNKFASQKGMSIGGVRHVSDIKADDINKESHKVINLQAGTNRFASQKGMTMGGVRHISDIKVPSTNPQSHAVINLQAGTNRFASQKGMSFCTPRSIVVNQTSFPCVESNSVIRLQAGTNQFANQKGLNFGKPRGINDMRVKGHLSDPDDQIRRYYDYAMSVQNSRNASLNYQEDDEGWL